MANWCSNTVVFEGSPETITAIQKLFQAMKEKEDKTEEGQLPEFVTDINGGYFFNIYWNDGDEGIYQYETKWSPNSEILQVIADRYKVDFVQDYEETGNLVYGRATCKNGTLNDTCLDGDDFDRYQQDEDTDLYHFEGEEYDSDCEILETILERKIAIL